MQLDVRVDLLQNRIQVASTDGVEGSLDDTDVRFRHGLILPVRNRARASSRDHEKPPGSGGL
jgi:hypothetical protein